MTYFNQKTKKQEIAAAISIRDKLLNSEVDDHNAFVYVDEQISLPIRNANNKLFKFIIGISDGNVSSQDVLKQISSMYRNFSQTKAVPHLTIGGEPFTTPVEALYNAITIRVDIPPTGTIFKLCDGNVKNKNEVERTINRIIEHSRAWCDQNSDRNAAISKIKKEVKEFGELLDSSDIRPS